LVERYFLARFDLFASQLLSVASPATTHGEAHYERYLNEFYEMERAQLRRLLPEMRSDVREEIISRISLKLSGRRSHWLREEISWRLQGCTPRPHLKVRWHLDADTNASETTSSIDAFMRRYSDQLERNRAAGASNGEMSNAQTAAPTQPPDSSLGGRIAAGEIGNGGGADKLKDTVRQAFWKDRQAEFLSYAKRFGDLSALWKVVLGKWVLWWGMVPSGHSIPQDCLGVLNAIARKASTELPSSANLAGNEPWQVWLSFMRDQRWGAFRYVGSPVPCTELEWDLGCARWHAPGPGSGGTGIHHV
jgi:hypothetical protein